MLTGFFTASYTGTRNNFTGALGFYFTVGATPVVVTALGRSQSVAIAGSHVVKLWSVSGPTEVASVTITGASPIDALGYRYVVLASPVTLSAGGFYRIASDEASGGDKWMNLGSAPSHLATAAISGGCYSTTPSAYPDNLNPGVDLAFVPPTFYTGTDAKGLPVIAHWQETMFR